MMCVFLCLNVSVWANALLQCTTRVFGMCRASMYNSSWCHTLWLWQGCCTMIRLFFPAASRKPQYHKPHICFKGLHNILTSSILKSIRWELSLVLRLHLDVHFNGELCTYRMTKIHIDSKLVMRIWCRSTLSGIQSDKYEPHHLLFILQRQLIRQTYKRRGKQKVDFSKTLQKQLGNFVKSQFQPNIITPP